MSRRFAVTLPLPPSSNRLWRNVNGKTLLSAEARQYKSAAALLVRAARSEQGVWFYEGDRLAVTMDVTAADRRRDLDNFCKIVLDSVVPALGLDDRCVDDIRLRRQPPDKAASGVAVTVETLPRLPADPAAVGVAIMIKVL